MPSKTVYHGQRLCDALSKASGLECRNFAYWKTGVRYTCSVHKTRTSRPLPRDPNREEKKTQEDRTRRLAIECVRLKNRDAGVRGKVICTKLSTTEPVDYEPGYLAVFPNARHGGRKDGLGVPALSPQCMGPIDHGQPGLPIAKNLESLPKFSLWIKPDGSRRHLSNFESRQVYCHFYEHIAKSLPEFKDLVTKLDDGYNLQIVGYDGYDVTRPLEDHYVDTGRPFGHEIVLYTLLTCPDPTDYPWRKHTFLQLPIPVPCTTDTKTSK